MKMVRYILKILVTFFLLNSCITTNIQDTPFVCELSKYPLKFVKVDLLGNIYTVDQKNRLKVFDQNMKLLFEYYNNGLGNISFLDITNPRKIIVFFPGFQKMIFLDNTLSEIGRVNTETNLPYDIRAIGSSRDNNLWIYDALDYRLKKIDPEGKTILESNPLESYLQLDILPNYIIEYNNEVFLIEENLGAAVFDNFGNYLRFTSLKSGSSINYYKEGLVYVQDQNLIRQSIENRLEEPIILYSFNKAVQSVFMYKKTLYYLENNCLKKAQLN